MFLYTIDHELALKMIDQRDTDTLFNLINESKTYLREWLPWVDHTKQRIDTEAFIDRCQKGVAENKSLTTVILYQGKIVGMVSINTLDWSNRIATIGYWLGENFQGKGIMTRAVQALIAYAFDELNLNRVEIQAAKDNLKSRSIPERLNFVQEGCLRQSEKIGDRFVDHVVYSILRDEWEMRLKE